MSHIATQKFAYLLYKNAEAGKRVDVLKESGIPKPFITNKGSPFSLDKLAIGSRMLLANVESLSGNYGVA